MGHGRQFVLLLADIRSKPQMAMVPMTIEFIDNCETGNIAVVVEAGDIDKKIESKHFSRFGANLRYTLGVIDIQRDFIPKNDRFGDESVKTTLQLLSQFESWHWLTLRASENSDGLF
jgi:hypothetical protein